MAMDKRHKDGNWQLPTSASGGIESWNYVHLALLMDIRDELKEINRTLKCTETQSIPRRLATISRNTAGLRKLVTSAAAR